MHAWILDIERTANNPNSDIEGLLRISFEVTETADPEALRGSFAAYRAVRVLCCRCGRVAHDRGH